MAGQLSLPDAEGALPPGLKVLSISHSDPLQLPACLPRLTALQRLNLSECTFGGGEGEAEAPDWAAPLVAATSLEVGWGRGADFFVGSCNVTPPSKSTQSRIGVGWRRNEGARNVTVGVCLIVRLPGALFACLEPAATASLSAYIVPGSSCHTAPVPACLQHLAMHYCTMARLPPALSGLTNLRALLLDYNDHQQLDEDLEEVGLPGQGWQGGRAGGRRTRALVFEGQGLPRMAASWIVCRSPSRRCLACPAMTMQWGPLLHRCWRHSSSCRSWGSATAG